MTIKTNARVTEAAYESHFEVCMECGCRRRKEQMCPREFPHTVRKYICKDVGFCNMAKENK